MTRSGLASLSALRRAPAAVALIGGALVGLVFAGFDTVARQSIVAVLVLILDVVGAVYSWRAGPLSPSGPTPWRLIAAGRAASAAATVGLAGAAVSGAMSWWWAGTGARLLMYALLAAGVLVPAVRQFTGRLRVALLAEVVTILAAGFMVVWYFALQPVLTTGETAATRTATIGWALGDLLLLAAVASITLRGVVTRFAAPVTVFAAGLTVYLGADVFLSANRAAGLGTTERPAMMFVMVVASLLMTCAPILTVSRAGQPDEARRTRPPAFATHLPMAAMLVGCLLMLVVTILEGQLLHWGGLVFGLIVMTCAAGLRQLVWLRESRDRITTDALTGLANRAGLDEALDRAVTRGEPAALLLLDLDGFKLVNDAYGHAAGDAFLTDVGRQLRSAVRATSSVCARIGGDEFAILLTDVTDADQAAAVAQRILAVNAATPVTVDGDPVPVRASIGIALANPVQNGKTLLRHADVAMYHGKRAGSHSYACYQPDMIDPRTTDAALADDLEHALDRGQLHVLYQPQIDLATGRTIAAEALIRWQHPTRGLVSPVQFIPIAERTGVINDIGLWVLEQALAQLAALPEPAGGGEPHISVNVSPRQLREPTIVHDILAVLDRAGADPRRLVLEITESALVDDTSGVGALQALREHGIRIAIDDFGTGYSSLQYLTRLPVDILKIDRSFVAELNNTPEGSAVAEAIIRLSQILHLDTVAEGIETTGQAAELRTLGCHTGQGYLYAKPLTPEAFTQHVALART